jgi:3-hydroxyacyl-[acyl-carrier-protein] dehydratase
MSLLDIELKQYSCAAVQIHESEWHQFFSFPASFIGFQGHFPDRPVLPAMIQLRMVRMLAEEIFGSIPKMNIRNAKFMSPILPEMNVQVSLHIKQGYWTARIDAETPKGSLDKAAEFQIDSPRD